MKNLIALFLIIIFIIPSTALVPSVDGMNFKKDEPLKDSSASFFGENSNDYAGSDFEIVGDVNGDGYDDILIGVGSNSYAGKDAGQTYLFFGKATGWSKDLNLSKADASFIGEHPGDYSGSTIAKAGDVNGDGYDDFLIASPWNSDNGNCSGKVYLIFGKVSGWDMHVSLSESDASFVGEMPKDYAGSSLASAGDVNKDGFDDFLIGAPERTDNVWYPFGVTYLIFGHSSGWLNGFNLSRTNASFLGESSQMTADSVAGVGDVNRDGYDDFMISGWGISGEPYGEAFLFLGKSAGWKRGMNFTMADASYIGENSFDFGSYQLSGVGDVNGDGYDDFIMGPYPAEWNMSPTYLFYGKPSGYAHHTNPTTSDASFIYPFTQGFSWVRGEPLVHGGGDINGDGYDDILIGDPWFDNGSYQGKTYVVFGKPDRYHIDTNLSEMSASFIGENLDDEAGWNVAGGGDVNHDGFDDIMIGAPDHNETGVRNGKIYLIFPNFTTEPNIVNSIKAYTTEMCVYEMNTGYIGDKVYVEMIGSDADKNNTDIATAQVRSNSTDPKGFQINLIETGKNTGIYRGNFSIGNVSSQKKRTIGAVAGENITISSVKDPAIKAIINVGLSISPSNDTIYIKEDEAFTYRFWTSGPVTSLWKESSTENWIKWRTDTHEIYGTPDNGDVGNHVVTVNVSIPGGQSISKNVTVIVINSPPKILTENKIRTIVNEDYFTDYNSTDDGQGKITWHLKMSSGNWLHINSSTGVLEGKATVQDVGNYQIDVSVDDGNDGWDHAIFTLMVSNTNNAPKITSKNNETANQDQLYSVQYTAADPDIGDVLTWSLRTNAGNWLKINSTTGILSGIPSIQDIGEYWVTVTVTDLLHASDSITYNLTVLATNHPPVITSKPELNATLGIEYTYQVIAVDPDKQDVLRYYFQSSPFGMIIDGKSGLIKWTPSNGQKWNNSVEVVVTDEKAVAHQLFTIFIPNRKPIVEPVKDKNISVGEKFNSQIIAHDPDPGDNLSFFIANAPSGLSITKDGRILWIPTKGQVGKHLIKVNVTDGYDVSMIEFSITVRPIKYTQGYESLYFLLIIVLISISVISITLFELHRKKQKDNIRIEKKTMDEKMTTGMKDPILEDEK